MSAIAENPDGPHEVIQVLFATYPNFGTLDFTGPLEVLNHATHTTGDSGSKAFECSIVGTAPAMTSFNGLQVRTDMAYDTAHEELAEYDILVVVGGIKGVNDILSSAEPDEAEPIKLIKAFAELQQKDTSKERTILGVCTGAVLLAQAGILEGMGATTHPDYYTRLEIVCKEAARKGDGHQTDVMEERYVVNNARYELGENIDDNPFILSRKPDGRRRSIARKGSNAWQQGKRRESILKRQNMRLGGLRVITSGGVMSGVDASLYIVAAMVSHDSAIEVARVLEYEWKKGCTVEGVDV